MNGVGRNIKRTFQVEGIASTKARKWSSEISIGLNQGVNFALKSEIHI